MEALGEFIRLYISRYERWSSPRYLFGESLARADGINQRQVGLIEGGIGVVREAVGGRGMAPTCHALYVPCRDEFRPVILITGRKTPGAPR